MDNYRLGKRIKAFRKLKGYTQADFAKEIGVSLAVFGNVERGIEDVPMELLNHIAKTLVIAREELTLGEYVSKKGQHV